MRIFRCLYSEAIYIATIIDCLPGVVIMYLKKQYVFVLDMGAKANDHSRTAIKLHGKFDDMPGSKFNCVPPADKMPLRRAIRPIAILCRR